MERDLLLEPDREEPDERGESFRLELPLLTVPLLPLLLLLEERPTREEDPPLDVVPEEERIEPERTAEDLRPLSLERLDGT